MKRELYDMLWLKVPHYDDIGLYNLYMEYRQNDLLIIQEAYKECFREVKRRKREKWFANFLDDISNFLSK